jgi:molybdate transport system ATP-binding protein
VTGDVITASLRETRGAFNLDARFEAPGRGVTAIFGPSGSGKTTVLRCIAGLHRAAQGHVAVCGEVWQDARSFRPVHRRPIGYVFQEASLFPHLSVRGNLLFGARAALGEPLLGEAEVVALLGLEPLLARAPLTLSGGERQRVAIGRALLSRPRLLLMDEPLSALDRAAREEILPFLEQLHERLSLPVLYVTHDMREVERLADHIILMDQGRVLAAGPLAQMQSDPALPLMGAREAAVSLEVEVAAYDAAYGLASLAAPGGMFLAPARNLRVGERRRLRILAGDVSLALAAPIGSTIVNILPARIVDAREGPDHQMTVVLGLGTEGVGAHLLARVTRRSWDQLALAPGLVVHAQVKGAALERL